MLQLVSARLISIFFTITEKIRRELNKRTWSLVFTTQRGFVKIVVAAPAPEAAIMLAPIERWWLSSTQTTQSRAH